MRVLGLYCGHDSSASVVEDGQIIACIEEERLTGIKKDGGFPARAVMYLSKMMKCSPFDFDRVMVATPCLHWGRWQSQDINKSLVLYPNAEFVDHHTAHAALAYCLSGWMDCVTVACDGGGDKYFATVHHCHDGNMDLIGGSLKDDNEAFGMLYYWVTEILGFIPNRHEGKVMGLAARGTPTQIFEDLFWVDGVTLKASGDRSHFIVHQRMIQEGLIEIDDAQSIKKRKIISRLKGISREDVAASVQMTFSKIMKQWISNCIKPGLPMAASGGSFANVLTNMDICRMAPFFVAPPMLDDGLSLGAALSAFSPLPVARPSHMYFGIGQIPRSHNKYSAKDVASMVASGKIVGLMQGRFEYGPRALGNRTILADPRDPTINDWLNARLNRSEFMPFAPVIMEEYARDILEDYDIGIDNAPFMTCCWNVKEEFKDKIPGVVHVDGTVRPQVISRKVNPYYWAIVDEFRRQTGIPCMVNTSWNGHEDPMIAFYGEADFSLAMRHVDIIAEN